MALRSVYLETTIVSYLVARPSRSVLLAAHQKTTKEWWANRRRDFDLFVSQVVIDEAAAGEKAKAAERLTLIAGLPLLEIEEEATRLARALTEKGPIPAKAARDALHLAAAAVHGMDFLLTWNCKHLANAEMAGRVDRIVLRHGFRPPRICTPEELMGGIA
jgi:predicted nucleic acid-binding protein